MICKLYFINVCIFIKTLYFISIHCPSPKVLINNLALGGLSGLSGLIFIPLLMWRPERRIILTCSYALVGICILGQGFLINNTSVGIVLGALAYAIMASAFGYRSRTFKLIFYNNHLNPPSWRKYCQEHTGPGKGLPDGRNDKTHSFCTCMNIFFIGVHA